RVSRRTAAQGGRFAAASPGSNRFPIRPTMSDTNATTPPAEQSRLRREEGQALVEYALILAFVSITAIALTPVGAAVAARLAEVAAALQAGVISMRKRMRNEKGTALVGVAMILPILARLLFGVRDLGKAFNLGDAETPLH